MRLRRVHEPPNPLIAEPVNLEQLEPLLVEIVADASKFKAAIAGMAKTMQRLGDSFERTLLMLTEDYVNTGVPPYGGRWSRRQMRPR